MARIYLSSTFIDLRAHRDEVRRTLGEQHEIVDSYDAASGNVRESCLGDVDACDIYVGIFAWRYGFVPDQENPDGRSLTELEYERARQLSKPCLVFLLDEEFPWPPAHSDLHCDAQGAGARVRSLRQKLQKTHRPAFFTTPVDLAQRVTAAVAKGIENLRAARRPSSLPTTQRYRVLERLASGAMAEVYLAESAGLEGFSKRVAIKRVHPHLSEKKRFVAMFLDEARLSARLSHPNCVQVFDIGVGDSTYFIVMEYVDGSDLKELMAMLASHGRALSVEQAILISLAVAEALAYAHELTDDEGNPLGIVHRDVCPANVLLGKNGSIKLVDFGLAKASMQLEKSEPGIIKGKFSYLSPETALGETIDARSDIFGIGVVLWEMLAGRRLFKGKTDYETVKLVQQAQVPPLSRIRADITPELEAIVGRLLARDRSQRFQSAGEVARALLHFRARNQHAIGQIDIAALLGIVAGGTRAPPEDASLIDKLIDETLLDFVSLRDQPQGRHIDLAREQEAKKNALALKLLTMRADETDDVAERVLLYREAADIHTHQRKDHGAAAELLVRAVELQKGNHELTLALCDAYTAAGRVDAALRLLNELVDSFGGRHSKELADIHMRISSAYLSKGDGEAALRELETARKMDAANLRVAAALGKLSIAMFDMASDGKRRSEHLARAEHVFKSLLLQKIDASSPIGKAEVFYYMAQVLTRMNEPRKAIHNLERAIAADKEFLEAKALLDKLKS